VCQEACEPRPSATRSSRASATKCQPRRTPNRHARSVGRCHLAAHYVRSSLRRVDAVCCPLTRAFWASSGRSPFVPHHAGRDDTETNCAQDVKTRNTVTAAGVALAAAPAPTRPSTMRPLAFRAGSAHTGGSPALRWA
jgi:hypothetical protein